MSKMMKCDGCNRHLCDHRIPHKFREDCHRKCRSHQCQEIKTWEGETWGAYLMRIKKEAKKDKSEVIE